MNFGQNNWFFSEDSFYVEVPMQIKIKIIKTIITRHAKRHFFYTNMVWAKIILPKKVRKLRQI